MHECTSIHFINNNNNNVYSCKGHKKIIQYVHYLQRYKNMENIKNLYHSHWVQRVVKISLISCLHKIQSSNESLL